MVLEALILAGGLGTRLRPVIGEHQKVVAPVAGRPFLLRLLDDLAAAGFGRVTLCTGYKAEEVEALGLSYRTLALRHSREPEPLGTGGALRLALDGLGQGPFLVLNGDSFCRLEHAAFRAAHRPHPEGAATIAAVEVPDVARFGALDIAHDGTISTFVEKGGRGGPGTINAGLYWLDRALLESIPPGVTASLEKEIFPAMSPPRLRAFRAPGPFCDIGTPETFGDIVAGMIGLTRTPTDVW